MTVSLLALLQAATPPVEPDGLWQRILHFFDTPAPYSPFSEYLLVMFVLWLIARRANRRHTFDSQAQDVLDEKYAQGEISEKAYRKHRQEMAVRPKR
jgi:isopentenyldiphosphate isomerase